MRLKMITKNMEPTIAPEGIPSFLAIRPPVAPIAIVKRNMVRLFILSPWKMRWGSDPCQLEKVSENYGYSEDEETNKEILFFVTVVLPQHRQTDSGIHRQA